jgi:hypothetical protein
VSEKPLAQKLVIKPGNRVRLVRAPEGHEARMGALPAGATVTRDDGAADVIQVFVRNRSELESLLPPLKADLAAGGMIWVCYLKAAKGVATDINRDDIREYVETIGLRAVAQVAVDAEWSAVRLKRL